MDQRDSVRDLRNNRNMEIVVMCPLAEVNILSCDLQQDNRLTDEDGIYLQQLNIVINTCNVSLSPSFMFSNGTMRRSDGLRCTTKIPLGQFSIMFDLNIFLNQTTNFTVITTMVSTVLALIFNVASA